jgi:Uma2 family endonuclease
MTPAVKSRRQMAEVTYEDYMAMPVSKQKTEVVDGVIYVMPGPAFSNQIVEGNVYRPLHDFVRKHDLGLVISAPADVFIRKKPKLRIRQPDIMYFSNERAGFRVLDEVGRLQDENIPPTLVVEVLSAGQWIGTLMERLSDYVLIGIDEVWIVEPEARTIQVLKRQASSYARARPAGPGKKVKSAVLPGFEIKLDDVFSA